MLTKISIKNFKLLEEVHIELGSPVVLVGPNNSGKTSALQALALWDIGLKRWNERRKGTKAPEKRVGVTINRRDLISTPVPEANLLWHELHVRDVQRSSGKQLTKNVLIEIVVEGVTLDKAWTCGLEFDYGNRESFYCRPLRIKKDPSSRMVVPDEAGEVLVAFLPPMSGLSANETRLDPGAINVRIGEGRTAEVLRNLCNIIYESNKDKWEALVQNIRALFGVELKEPQYVQERGEIVMSYLDKKLLLDISATGRGLQQTLLLLAYMYSNPGSVLLLDEPDAHLEILRQRQIYRLISKVAIENGNQIIAASHSEVLLNEAVDKDVVVAFIGKRPHRINDRGTQLLKSLRDIGFEDYYLAQQNGWVLYLEGSTDLEILQEFAEKLKHAEAMKELEKPFVHYVGNQLSKAKEHYFGLLEGMKHLRGVVVLDRDTQQERSAGEGLVTSRWDLREIESYFCKKEVLLAYAGDVDDQQAAGPLFSKVEKEKRVRAMEEAIGAVEQALETLGQGSPWGGDLKVSDEFLPKVFDRYFKKLGLPNVMLKKNYHVLVKYLSSEMIVQEVGEKLDAIVACARGKA